MSQEFRQGRVWVVCVLWCRRPQLGMARMGGTGIIWSFLHPSGAWAGMARRCVIPAGDCRPERPPGISLCGQGFHTAGWPRAVGLFAPRGRVSADKGKRCVLPRLFSPKLCSVAFAFFLGGGGSNQPQAYLYLRGGNRDPHRSAGGGLRDGQSCV